MRRWRRASSSGPRRSAVGRPASIEVRLIRHGQTQGYIADSALTPLGRWQAHRKGQDLAKGLTEGAVARIVHGPAARTEETAVALAEGMRQAVARYGIHDVTVTEPEPIDALPQLPGVVRGPRARHHRGIP